MYISLEASEKQKSPKAWLKPAKNIFNHKKKIINKTQF